MAASSKGVMREWKLQRYTGALIGVYALGLLLALIVNGAPTVVQWHGLFGNTLFKLVTLAVVLALCYHALIGVLHVWPDYVKPPGILKALNAYSHAAVGLYIVWCLYILFGLR
jgi:succinate dehydrogenase / fumarate reductase membrane anchor subunit